MKKWNFRSYIAGVLTAVLILGLCIPTIAATIQKQMAVTYKNIKICIDGNEITPKDANGNVVEPFVSGGTTYLPVRAVGEAFGKDVAWDNATNTVYVGRRPDDANGLMAKGDIIADQNGVKITYAGASARAGSIMGGYQVDVMIENTTDKDVIVQVRDVSINGYMVNEAFSCNVAAGKKANDSIEIYQDELDKNGISVVNTIEAKFVAFDADSYNDIYETGPIKIKVK